MVVSCPKCSSRYQLPDEKVRDSGTKVRCPRCQNTFKVFPSTSKSEFSEMEKTELSLPRQDVQRKPAPQKTAEVPQKSTEADTAIRTHRPAASAPETMRSSKTREPSPFKKPSQVSMSSRDSDWEDVSEPTENDRTAANSRSHLEGKSSQSEPSESDQSEATFKVNPSSQEAKPFGDATFLAIQKMGGAKESRKKLLVSVTFGLMAVALLLFFFIAPQTRSPLEPVASKSPQISVKLNRPANWYQDNPATFQRLLSQMATLPKTEQEKPEVKALIAEALVLNGIGTGAYDQVAQGTAIASDLITAYPDAAFGFYARAAYAIYKDDVSGITTLAANWPKPNQTDPEFLLINMLVLSRSGQKATALSLGKELIETMPNFERAELALLNIALDSTKDAESILGEKRMTALTKVFTNVKESLQTSGAALPDLVNNIDKKLLRKNTAVAAAKSPEIATSKSATTPATRKSEGKVSKKEETDKSRPTLTEKAKETEKSDMASATPKPDQPEKPAQSSPAPSTQSTASNESGKTAPTQTAASQPTPAKAPTKLPPPAADLVASNKQQRREESEAGKLYQLGLTHIEQGRTDEAVLSFQKSLRFDPDYAESYRKLGEIYMKRDERDKALRSLKIYLRLRPDSSDRQVVQGWISSLE